MPGIERLWCAGLRGAERHPILALPGWGRDVALPGAVIEGDLAREMSAVSLSTGTGGSNPAIDTVRVLAEGADLERMEIELQAFLEGISSTNPGRKVAEAGITGRAGDATQDVMADPGSGCVEATIGADVGASVVPVVAPTSLSAATGLVAPPSSAAEPVAVPASKRETETPALASPFESPAILAHMTSVEIEAPLVRALAEGVKTRASEPSIEPADVVVPVGQEARPSAMAP